LRVVKIRRFKYAPTIPLFMTIESKIATIPVAIHCIKLYEYAGQKQIQATLAEYWETSVAVDISHSSKSCWTFDDSHELYVTASQVISSPNLGTISDPKPFYRIIDPNLIEQEWLHEVRIILMGGESNLQREDMDGCHKSAYVDFVNWFFRDSPLEKMEIIVPFDSIFNCRCEVMDDPKYKENFLRQYSTERCQRCELIDGRAQVYFAKAK
jgi:hypothetical protein